MDSSEWAFYQATQSAFEECCEDGIWQVSHLTVQPSTELLQVLEPIMSVEVNSPQEFSSSVYSLVNNRSGLLLLCTTTLCY